MCFLAKSDCHTTPSRIVCHSTVIEVEAGFLTRHVDHREITFGYFDFRKTSNNHIVLLEFSLALRHPGVLERPSVLHGDRPSCIRVGQLVARDRKGKEFVRQRGAD